MEPRTANLTVLYSEQSALHHTGSGHPENTGRMDWALEGVSRAGAQWRPSRTRSATDLASTIERVHGAAYVKDLAAAVTQAPALFQSPDNPISSGSLDAALGALAAAEEAVTLLSSGAGSRAFVVARPPGHHAERNRAMGFCFFNTIACAAESLLASGTAQKIAIVDFDVHHGNGTQSHFWNREDVLFASIHQWPFYPGTGAASERGAGAGDGATLNVPMEAGADDVTWLRAFERQIVSAVDGFAPDVVLISAGFDAHERDPLGGMRLTADAYGEMTRMLVDVANRHARGGVLSLIEGGYDPEGIASGVAAHVSGMLED